MLSRHHKTLVEAVRDKHGQRVDKVAAYLYQGDDLADKLLDVFAERRREGGQRSREDAQMFDRALDVGYAACPQAQGSLRSVQAGGRRAALARTGICSTLAPARIFAAVRCPRSSWAAAACRWRIPRPWATSRWRLRASWSRWRAGGSTRPAASSCMPARPGPSCRTAPAGKRRCRFAFSTPRCAACSGKQPGTSTNWGSRSISFTWPAPACSFRSCR